ncbi:protein kinase domain-containing protein [Actinomycetospora cinnamomea]|uniref:non-specific serine/threonine protein kinase n=1 Tax=Actinomycetospora cinnamomea TaxID=663609 RepID=A0A2U1FIS3_9PSEU|nr:protein kinase [Actinomycetospora cinnamomea]PVZ12082.1 serine/threonine protein kinase [Actinomycetospora cinnamomea]
MSAPGPARVLQGRYELRELIGRGGMAEVHRAVDLELGRAVAVKLLPAEHRGDAEFGGRLRDEARAAAAIDHPNVVAVHDVGFADGGEVFVVMECVHGRTLRQELQARGRLDPGEATAVLGPVCDALAAAHDRGIVHRDVNPGNIMRCHDGTVKLMDFGIARVADVEGFTGTGVVMGTAAYLSPEQVRCDPLDGRSDVYAVGCTLYELLTGQTPFRGPSSVEVASQRLREPPIPPRQVRPDLSPDLDAVVLRALALEPAMRHHDARELADDLRRFATADATARTEVLASARSGGSGGGGGAVPATRPQDVPDEGPDPGERNPWSWVRVLGLALVVLAVLVLAVAGVLLAMR